MIGLRLFKLGSNLLLDVEGDREQQAGGIVTRALSKGVGVVFAAAIFESQVESTRIRWANYFWVACCWSCLLLREETLAGLAPFVDFGRGWPGQ
jgi:hypothetical protein